MDCVFCAIRKDPDQSRVLLAFQAWFLIFSKYEVTEGHSLLIPNRHVSTYDELSYFEKDTLISGLDESICFLKDKFKFDGLNIGLNNGKAAGQTIFHTHWHLIPRRIGDMEDPRGGVRGVIPDRRIY